MRTIILSTVVLVLCLLLITSPFSERDIKTYFSQLFLLIKREGIEQCGVKLLSLTWYLLNMLDKISHHWNQYVTLGKDDGSFSPKFLEDAKLARLVQKNYHANSEQKKWESPWYQEVRQLVWGFAHLFL